MALFLNYYLINIEQEPYNTLFNQKTTYSKAYCARLDICDKLDKYTTVVTEHWIFPQNRMTEIFWAHVVVNVHAWRLWGKEGNRVSPKRGWGTQDGFIIHGLIGFVAV